MSPRETILKLIRDKTVDSDLRRRSGNSDAVRADIRTKINKGKIKRFLAFFQDG